MTGRRFDILPKRLTGISSVITRSLLLCMGILSFFNTDLSAQVISNTGSNISLTSGIVVNAKDLKNTSGILGNNGTINLSGFFFNSGSAEGNGFFNLTGDWTDFGLFTPGNSTVTFQGITNQTITNGSFGESFYRLIINNPGKTITQITPSPGGILTVNNNLTITAGTLSLDQSTDKLTVGGKATIAGSLLFNNLTTQTTSISDSLTGAGLIDMSFGNLPHILNLGGRINSIGTFTTSPSSSSTVNYNGTTQTVFPATNYRNLVISNSGVKTLQGNSAVNLRLIISGGTFDLGTVATTFSVTGSSKISGALAFGTTTAKTVALNDSLYGTGAIDMSGENRLHLLNLNGTINSIGSLTSGSGSTVDYIRADNQTVFISNDYNNLKISGGGIKSLYGDIAAKGILTMLNGDINPDIYTLKVLNSSSSAINWSAGKVTGKLQRAIGSTGNVYLYPIGSASSYNPLKMKFQNLISGPVTAQYKPEDIGWTGPALDDNGDEIYDRYPTGYWTLTSFTPMSSNSYNVILNLNGFSGVDLSSRVIKRTDSGVLALDGKNGVFTGTDIARDTLVNGISTITTDLAVGKGRPRIDIQPVNIDVCEGSNAFFQVTARGHGTLSYRWQIYNGTTFVPLFDGGFYTGTDTKKLLITGALYSLNGSQYRCIITDAQGNSNITNTVLLTVNKIPQATVVPTTQNVCSGVTFTLTFGTSNNVPGTSFAWSHDMPAGIYTSSPTSGTTFDQVSKNLINNYDYPITVTFTIFPTGPGTTYCPGSPITATVKVNPTPRIFPVPPDIAQCDSTTTSIELQSPSTFTTGSISFNYTVSSTGAVSGYAQTVNGLANHFLITDKLVNHTNVYQTVTYSVTPVSPAGCADGPTKSFSVTVNPTPTVSPVNLSSLKPDSSICNGGSTNILLTSWTQMSSGYGHPIFDFKVTSSGVPGAVTGVMTPDSNRVPGYNIIRAYQNSSDSVQSVYFAITPKLDNAICKKGPVVVSTVKVHAKPLQVISVLKPFTCSGSAGLAELRAVLEKGANPYHVVWDGPVGYHVDNMVLTGSKHDILNLPSGQYTVAVTDNLSCKGLDSIVINQPTTRAYIYSPPIATGGNYNISCIGSTDGTILTAVTGGMKFPYRYWVIKNDVDTLYTGTFTDNFNLSDPNTFKYYYNLGAGSYSLYIRDINGCSDLGKIIFRIPPPVVVNFGKFTYAGGYNVSCKGYNDGSAWIQTISGGRGSYTYRWYTYNGVIPGPVNTNRIDNLVAGKYYLETKDILSCVKIDSVIITEPAGMLLAGYVLSRSGDNNFNISCNGGNDGSISLTITGGSGSYLYSWTGPNGFTASTRDISGLVTGTYTVTVRDLNGCLLMPLPTFTLSQPTPLGISITRSVAPDGTNNISCNGGTGNINLTVSGGSIGKYRYVWSSSDGSGIVQGQKNQTALTAGTYHVVVTDTNRCEIIRDITLIQPTAVTTQLIPKHITCSSPGFSNGSINLTVNGGIPSYSYSWSNGAATEDIANLTQGLYKVRVTDNNGCIKKDSVTINLPPVLTFSSSKSDFNGVNISCYGQSNGAIQITPVTGKAPFLYSWTGPASFASSSQNINGLRAGQYNLQITDSNMCTASGAITLTEPGKLDMTIAVSKSFTGDYNINCAGDSTGSIIINPVNGVGNVSYLWADGSVSKTRSLLPAGRYDIIITDKNNCHADTSIVLTQPDSIKTIFAIKQAFCPDSPDGEIQLKVTGGSVISDYFYRWSSDNSSGSTLSNILRGLYKVTVTDANKCTAKDSIMMEPLHETCLIIPNAISPNSDNINDVWNIGMIYLYPLAEVKVFNRWGELIWKSQSGYPQPWDGRSNGKILPIDSYYYIIDLHNGSRPVSGNITIVR